VSLGNPLLKPFRSDNLDASAEYYFAKGGLLSVAAFAKFIKNPIFVQSFTQNDVSFGGRQYETLDFSQPRNADKGKIFGIEVAFQQQFTFLPGILSGFGVELNATFVNSKLRLPDGRDSTFPQQSDYLYGAQLFYEKGRVEASIAYHNTGKSLLSAGDEEFEDQYNNDLRRVDAKASFEVVKNVRLFAEGQNLTDEPTRQYQGGRTDWITQNERYGRTFYIGVSASL
jgi:TonB-dependent receptor